jgi:hypothetical protein
MRAIRTWGSVRGVLGDWHPYRDLRRDATRVPTQGPERRGGSVRPKESVGRLDSPMVPQIKSTEITEVPNLDPQGSGATKWSRKGPQA